MITTDSAADSSREQTDNTFEVPQSSVAETGANTTEAKPPKKLYRTLVTGGAGFVGSHLVKRLLDEGHEVLVVDNYYSGPRRNIRDLPKQYPNLEIQRLDITRAFVVECDRIYHLACPASPAHYQNNAIKTLKTNVVGTLNVLGIARRAKARILLASTSEVYGDPLQHPQNEDYYGNVNPCGTRSCYDEGKRAAETLVMDYHRQHNIDVRIARIFNTYGPNMCLQDGRVISNFIVQALKGDPLTIYGDGSQTRSFCYVDDTVDGLIRLMESDYVGPVNIGNPDEYTIIKLAQSIRDRISPQLPIQFMPLPKDDPSRRRPDIGRARKYLNWNPTTTLAEGLDRTIEDFRVRASGDDIVEYSCWEQSLASYGTPLKVQCPTTATLQAKLEETIAELERKENAFTNLTDEADGLKGMIATLQAKLKETTAELEH